MDVSIILAHALTFGAGFAVGFILGHMRKHARTSIEKAAVEALKVGDHPPAYVEPPTPPTVEEKK